MDPQDSDMEGSVSNNEDEMSEDLRDDEDSEDAITRLPGETESVLDKLKLQVHRTDRDRDRDDHDRVLSHSQLIRPPSHSPRDQPLPPTAVPMMPPSPFSLPMPFPFPHPAAAFLPPLTPPTSTPYNPAPTGATLQNSTSSASSHSSESSTSSQQTWSFEEQFKQLYEINDDPKRKEFLDDLFSYMQKRGTPINRLPIMAKSVLDLYELYNLVIARGGLVDVINKKLWQEIIKGLHLPSSITSAAFTLRTQYMKYLYPYECDKRRLSTPAELQAAIDGNRREGRRSSYGSYAEMVQRSPVSQNHHAQMSPLSLVTAAQRPMMNGNSNNHHHAHPGAHMHPAQHPALAQHMAGVPMPGLVGSEFEARMVEYVKLLNKELRDANNGSASPPSPPSPQEAALNALEMSRLTLWNLYNNNVTLPTPPSAEPQKEALNLGVREQEARQARQEAMVVKREAEEQATQPAKRIMADDDGGRMLIGGTHIKIASRGDGRGGQDNSLVVSMDINGTMYQGVLFAQNTRKSRLS